MITSIVLILDTYTWIDIIIVSKVYNFGACKLLNGSSKMYIFVFHRKAKIASLKSNEGSVKK